MDEASSNPCVFLKISDNGVTQNFSPHDILTLSQEQTANIISPFFSHPRLDDTKVRMTEENLAHFNTGISKQFVPKRSLLPQFKLRLLSLQTGSDSAGNNNPAYCALSYCCSTSPAKCFAQNADGENTVRLPVSDLLSAAIINDARKSCPAIWCDQICIDQSNIAERAVTLSFTDAIYHSAYKVAVALEDVQVDSSDEEFLRWFTPQYQTAVPASEPDDIPVSLHWQSPPFAKGHPQLIVFFRKIMQARWFRRAWCAHEMRVSTNQLIYIPCSGGEVAVRMTTRFLNSLCHLAGELPHLTIIPSLGSSPVRVAVNTLVKGVTVKIWRQSALEIFSDLDHLESGGNPGLEPQLREQTAILDKFIIALNSSLCGLTFSTKAFEKASLVILKPGSWHRLLTALALALRDPLALCASAKPPHIGMTTDPAPWWLCAQFADTSVTPDKLMPPDHYLQSFTFNTEDFDDFISLPLSISSTWKHKEASLRHTMLATAVLLVAREEAVLSDTLEEAPDMGSVFSWASVLQKNRLRLGMQVLGCILECGVQWLLSVLDLRRNGTGSSHPFITYPEAVEVWKVLGDSWPDCLAIESYQNEEEIQNNEVVKLALKTWISAQENLKAIYFIFELVQWICVRSLPLLSYDDTEMRSYTPYIWTFGDDDQQTRRFLVVMHDKYRDVAFLPAIPKHLLEDKFCDSHRCWMVRRKNRGQMPPTFRLCARQRMYGPSVEDVFSICRKVAVYGPDS